MGRLEVGTMTANLILVKEADVITEVVLGCFQKDKVNIWGLFIYLFI